VKKVPLIALLTANALSMIGNVFAMISIPWFVLQTTGSPAKTGITGFFMTLAAVIAAFLGGAIVDRLGFKPTSILADLFSGLVFAAIPLFYATTGLAYWQLLILVFLGNLFDAPGTTAREALIPDLAAVGEISLEQASGYIQAVERGARMVGAPLAGILITVIGARNVIWIDAASFIISALIVAVFIPAGDRESRQTGETTSTRYLADVREGLAFILKDRLLLMIILVVVVSNFLDTPLSGVIYPVYFQRYFGDAVNLGLVISAGGAGALITALIYGAVGRRFSRRWLFLGGFLLSIMRFFVLDFIPPAWVLILVAFISGLAAGPINPVISTVSYERIPADFRGRVLGTLTALAYIAMPLGSALAGILLEWLDLRVFIFILGLLYLITILVAATFPEIRQMDERPSTDI
jgi:MFS family permease